MLFTNLAGRWPALVVVLPLLLAVGVGLLYLAPEAIRNQPTTAGAGGAESTSGPLVQEPARNFPGWEWPIIAVLVGVIIGMTVGIALSRPPVIS